MSPAPDLAARVREAALLEGDFVLSSGKRLVTYCASGARAALAAKTLADMGVTRVAHVHGGGFEALRAAGAATRS